MDTSWLSQPGAFEGAYQSQMDREFKRKEMEARVLQLVEDARQKAEMQPYEMKYKEAMINELNARAENYNRDKSNPQHKAQAMMLGQQALHPYYAAALANEEDNELSGILNHPQVSEELKNMLRSVQAGPSRRKILEAYSNIAPRSKEVASVEKGRLSRDATLGSAELRYHASRERGQVLERIAAIRGSSSGATKDKTSKNFEEEGHKWYNRATSEQDAEKQKQYFAQAQYFYNLALQKAEQSAMARQTGDLDMSKLPGSTIPTKPAPVKAPDPNPAANAPGTKNNPIKLQ